MYVKFIGHYFHLRMTGSANFLQKVCFATEEIKYMEKITLEMPLLAFCVCVCQSSKNKDYRNLLEFTNKPKSGLNFWLKLDNSLNLSFQVLQNTEC